MKTNVPLLVGILWGILLFFSGCESGNNPEPEPMLEGQLAFTTISTRSGDDDKDSYGSPHSDRNLIRVPDAVGVFANKAPTISGSRTAIMKNAIYRVSQDENTNNNLFWYKTSDKAAYWDRTSFFDIYAYAPVEEGENDYYSISDNGVVSFNMNPRIGLPVDFIYASAKDKQENPDADLLHMKFRHKLCKIVFILKNGTDNVVVCNGVRFSIQYPKATFNLIDNEWTFDDDTENVNIQVEEQYEIFSDEEHFLPELTTLLFPINATNITPGFSPSGVIMDFVIILNNKEYSVKEALEGKNLEYEEGKLIELTFNCKLTQGSHPDDGVLWNIYSATFDSFEDGGSFDGRLE